MHASSIICAIKIKCYSSCVRLVVGRAICAEARCLWKIYISIGGEGYMVWTQTCQQIDKVTGVHSCSWTHRNKKNVPSPKIEKYAEHATCINWKAQNQSCHPQQHLLLKGNTKSLCIYDIPSSAFLLQNLFFCFARGISVLFAYRSIVSTWKEQTKAAQRDV